MTEACQHPNVSEVTTLDSADVEWICQDCGAAWTTPRTELAEIDET